MKARALATALLFAGATTPALAASDGRWEWIVAPYAWGASVSTDLHTQFPPPGGDGDNTFGDVLDDLDGAFEVHAEGQGDHFGVFTDFTYLGLADQHDFRRFHTESDLDTRLFELAAVWNPSGERFGGFELFGGLRYIDVDFTSRFIPVNPAFPQSSTRLGESFSDFMLGARYTWTFADKWGVTLRGDGSFGDTEGTWNASAIASYRTRNGAWYFGYRYLNVSLEPGQHRLDIAMHGPMLGYGFRF